MDLKCRKMRQHLSDNVFFKELIHQIIVVRTVVSMIISHKYKFIFIKTSKTAGTSIELLLEQLCAQEDIITPIYPEIEEHKPRNYSGFHIPILDPFTTTIPELKNSVHHLMKGMVFYNHIPASLVKTRVSNHIWNSYYKFSVERNPWDKTLSHYHMLKHRNGGELSLDEYFDNGRFCLNIQKYTDLAGKLIVDKVIKYENLNEEINQIFKHLKIPSTGKLTKKAKASYRTDRSDYKDVMVHAQKEIIEYIFRKEISLHGYSY
jgi:hypothetical protein